MATRKLTKRQQARVTRIQEKRRNKHASEALPGTQGETRKGQVITRHGQNLVIKTETGDLKHCLFRQNLGHLVCGDQVLWQNTDDESGVVTAILPRHSVLSRPDYSGRDKPIAANISLLAIVMAPRPAPTGYLLDQYLAAAEIGHMDALIVVNKVDLLISQDKGDFFAPFSTYEEVGYKVIAVSAKTDHGLDPLVAALNGQTSILVGQSGVGKSSLINALVPNQETQVGALSKTDRHGRHTTSSTTLFHLPTGGEIIDSPGVRSFRLGAIDKATLESGFKEFRPYLGQCRFSNCEHQSEPGCALVRAVEEGTISQQRLDTFLHMIDSAGYRY